VSGAPKYATCGKIHFIAILLNVNDRQRNSKQQKAEISNQQKSTATTIKQPQLNQNSTRQ